MKTQDVVNFRKDLRKFELLLEKQLNLSICRHKVTLPQCHALLAIEEMGQCTLNILAQSINLEKSTVSRTIDILVTKKFVSRKTNPENRRETIISLTKNGLTTVEDINRENNKFFKSVFKQIKNKNISEVISSFNSIVAAFDLTINKGDV